MAENKKIYLGYGVSIVESSNNICLHLKSETGDKKSISLGKTNKTPGHKWATELLDRLG